MSRHVHLGFEVGTGEPIAIPLRNLAVTGQTQESGKTTTLEALVSRADVPAIAFVTKRGETAFAGVGNRLQPYFRDRADWQFVTSILDATLQEKNKFLRPWIIRICRTTKTLADVQKEVQKELKTAKGMNAGVYTQLDAYLDLIVPEIHRTPLAKSMKLDPGVNVMDVSSYATPMQMLFVQSAIDWVNEHEKQTVVIVPEAWEFIPEGKGSPVKASAVALARKGSGIGNHIWVDSQDMAGVDKTILRGCPVWLIGVQREANEIKRNLANIPAGIQKPKAEDIANLDRGQFYACWKDRTVKVYVQPAWMNASIAKSVSLGKLDSSTLCFVPEKKKREVEVTEQEAAALREENRNLKARIDELEKQMRRQASPAPAALPSNNNHEPMDVGAVYEAIKSRLANEAPALLQVLAERPELRVAVKRRVIEVGGDTLRGRIARLIADQFFSKARQSGEILAELQKRGVDVSNIEFGNEMKALMQMGFFTRDNKWYSIVEGMKVNVVEG